MACYCVQLFATQRNSAPQASLSLTISQSLLKLISIEWVMPSNISSSFLPLSSCLQSFPASGNFLMNWLFTSGGKTIGASASALVLRMIIQDWFPLGLTGLISFQSKGLSKVFSNTTAQQHYFSFQASIWSNSHIYTWLLDKPVALMDRTLLAK